MASLSQIETLVPRVLAEKEKYAPLNIEYENILKTSTRKLGVNLDGLATISLFDNQVKFFAELVPNTSPKIILSKLGLLSSYGQQLKQKKILENANRTFGINNQIHFLLIVPYITEEIKKLTEDLFDFSVLDLCGNYLIKSKNLSAVRLDQPNEYPDNKPIQNVYKGVSSLVARTFLEGRREYESLTDFAKEVNELSCPATLSTVSKVVSALEADLIVERNDKKIRLLQADRLLQKLLENYSRPCVQNETRLKVNDAMIFAKEIFSKKDVQTLIFSGESSIQKYVIATQPQIYTIYTFPAFPNQAFKEYGASVDSRFFNVVMQSISDPGAFFAPLEDGNLCWAGKTQTYLELMSSDKRGKELAEPLRDIILKGVS